jgi:hypothetical protein
VIGDVGVQQRVAVLHREEGGIQRGRIQIVSKLGHHAEVHGVLLRIPVIQPLESAEWTNQSTRRVAGRRTQSDTPGTKLGITSNHE